MSLLNWWFKVTVLSYVCVFVGACSGAGVVFGAGVVLGAVSAVPIGPPVLGATARTRAEAGGSAPVGACVFGAMALVAVAVKTPGARCWCARCR